MPAAASVPGAAALLEILLRIDEGNLPGGRGAENNGGGSSEQGGEEEDVKIEMNVEAAGKIVWREPQQRTNRLQGDEQAEGHADEGQRHALGEHLAGQAPRRAA